jgi:hypothetical protein
MAILPRVPGAWLFSSDFLTKTFSVRSSRSWDAPEGSIYTYAPTNGGIQKMSVIAHVVAFSRVIF